MIRIFALVIFSWSTLAFAFDWQGHRGARGLYPENTIGAMEVALGYKVNTLEMDVVISKDHKVVVSHEPWMNHDICLDGSGKRVKKNSHNLFQMTYEEIQKFDCGSLPHPRFPKQKSITERKPLLEQLLAETDKAMVHYNIEIKSSPEQEKEGSQPDYKSFTDLVVKTISAKLKNERFTLQSFDWRVLRYLHEKYPEVQTSALIEDGFDPRESLKELGFRPTVFSPYFKKLKAKHVEFFHSLGIKVIPWTVNDVKMMEKLISMGVDGIITDYPNLISEVKFKKTSNHSSK